MWTRRARVSLLASLALGACGERVRPTPDATLPDATLEDGSSGDPRDVSAHEIEPPPTRSLSLRVVLGPFIPGEPASGFSVIAVGPAGLRVTGSTDAEGRAALDVPAVDGAWDVTVARTGFLAVSIVDARMPMDATVYTEALTERRQSIAPRALTARFRGAAESSVASLFSRSLVDSEYAGSPDWTLEQHDDVRPGNGPSRFYGIEWRSDGSGFPLRPLRAVALEPVAPDRRGPIAFSVDFSRESLPAVESQVSVVLPDAGLVQRGTVRRGAPSRVQFAYTFEEGAWYASYPVGTASAEFARDAPGPVITVAHLSGTPDFLPAIAGITYSSEGAAQPYELQLWPAVTGVARTLRVDPVQALAAQGAALESVEVEALGGGYHPGFAVLGADGQAVGWVGYTQDGRPLARRRLPALPAGFSPREHFRGPTARVIATLSRRTTSDRPPWEPGALRSLDVEVDSAFVMVPLR